MTSIGAAGALFQPAVMQSGLSGLGGSDPIGNLLQALNGPDNAPAPTAPASPDPAPPPGASGPFDPSTFTALLSAQEQSAPAFGSGGPGGSGDATGIDPSPSSSGTDGSGADSSGGSTTETVTNPDGSVTTITTYGDGTVSESTTAPTQGASMTATMGDDADDLTNSLQQLASLVQPFASVAAAALL